MKDLIDQRGRVTTSGSRLRKDKARRDAPVVGRLRRSGAILIGRTNLHEFAYGITNINPHYGPTRNPYDLARMAGGSSGGSAAAVAVRSAAAAIGTDTAGSIRVPAALCGVVGLKPTYGAVPREGVEPLAWSLDHVGSLTRSVRDADLMFSVLADRPARPLMPSARVRVGIPAAHFLEVLDGAVRRAFHAARRTLERQGGEVVPIRLPSARLFSAVRWLIVAAESAAWHEDDLRTSASRIGRDVRLRLRQGLGVRAIDYLRAQRIRGLLIDEVNAALESCDVLLVPTTAVPAIRLDARRVRIGRRSLSVREALIPLTMPFNVTGHPAVAVPSGTDAAGLPVSVQIVGRHFDERRMLSVAAVIERELDLRLRPPDVPPALPPS